MIHLNLLSPQASIKASSTDFLFSLAFYLAGTFGIKTKAGERKPSKASETCVAMQFCNVCVRIPNFGTKKNFDAGSSDFPALLVLLRQRKLFLTSKRFMTKLSKHEKYLLHLVEFGKANNSGENVFV